MTKKILITGNLGYIGPVLIKFLRKSNKSFEILGYDTGFFAHCLTDNKCHPEVYLDKQYYGDIRHLPKSLLENIDSVIHLSAISNDPMGNQFEKQTFDINYESSTRLANLCSEVGVKNFIFASSCSIYGFSDKGPRKEDDKLNPLTAYASSKVNTEKDLKIISEKKNNHTTFTCLRFSTACGISSRLRLDLVLNDFVASAICSKKITVLSDGSPWRPLIDVEDMALSIDWAMSDRGNINNKFLSVNIGSDNRNYQVSELANCVADEIKGTIVEINKDALPDKRSYKVDFSLFKKLAPNHQPRISLKESIKRLSLGLNMINFSDKNFRSSQYMRLRVLQDHIKDGRLDKLLNWKL